MKKPLQRLVSLFLTGVLLLSCGFVAFAAAEATDYNEYRKNSTLSEASDTVVIDVDQTLNESAVTFEADIPADGLYRFGLSYKALDNKTSNLVFGLQIDGEYPFEEAKKLNLYRMFCDSQEGIRVDGLGNQFAPKQVPYEDFWFDTVTDVTRWTDEAYLFALTQGVHTVSILPSNGEFAIKQVTFSSKEQTPSYVKPKKTADYYDGKDIIIEGESAIIKTGNWLAAKADNSSLDITPNDAYNTLANYVGGNNWKSAGQTIVWETPELEEGYYKIGFSYRQSGLIGAKVYRRMKIDGEVPFDEANAVGFGYSYQWQNGFFADKNNDPYLVYFSKGKHTISLEVTPGEIEEVRNQLKKIVEHLSKLYVDITMITGETVDMYRDYDLLELIPNMEKTLKALSVNLGKVSSDLQKITGEKSGSYISVINNMKQIVDLMLNNRYVAHRYKDEYYSKYTSLGSVLYEMSDMPLDLDKISLVSPGVKKPFENANFFKKMAFSAKKFFVSFGSDYNNISGSDHAKDGITIWVNWGRDQAQVLNSLIQSEFTPKSGVSVNVQIVNATVIQAILSGQGPDCLIQHSRSEPVNLAMRGILYDLTQFGDYKEVLKNFHEGAELPYYYKGGLYGLPDTQSFYLMFYRKDIFEEMDLKVPETWDEFTETVKLLTRNKLTAWLPNNTATSTAQANIGLGSINIFPTLLKQLNLEVYREDGRATLLSDSELIMAFNKWTDFYKKLKLPRTMNFYNRFRTGTCPLGIDTYTLYTTLKAAAPEIDGLWSVALVPGTKDENGNVNHTSTGGGTACSILKTTKNPENAWKFLRWWVSSETQLAYSSEVESILGPTGRVAVSNMEAFKGLEWDPEMRDVIISSLENATEIPEFPGSYYVSRSVYQAFWNVVENNKNAKQTLLEFAKEADQEIARKWKQYENR